VSQKRYRYTGKEKDEESGLYYHGARYYACWLGRWTATDPMELVDGLNLYMYCRGNPVCFKDPTGCSTTFYQGRNGNWRLLTDNKVENLCIGVFGFIPFLDDAIRWTVDAITGNKTVSRNMWQDIATKVGATAQTASLLGGVSKFAKVAGNISTAITISNLSFEFFINDSYINQITHKMYDSYYSSDSFDTTLTNFVAYAAIVKDLVDKGIVTYNKDWGIVKDLKIDWDRHDSYFDDLGIHPKEIAEIFDSLVPTSSSQTQTPQKQIKPEVLEYR